MTADTKELDALAAAMNRSADRLQTLWFTFLGVTLYFAISAFTTTHRMLLLEEGQTLPILNVKLPLLPFYVIAPLFYVVLHAYMLMMLVLLARTARTFEDALNAPGGLAESERERYRMRLENALFLQIIVGASRERSGANGVALRAIALTTLAIAPVLLLLLFQLMFLPYHSEVITWWHRLLLVVDLAIVWTLWPCYRHEWGQRMRPRIRPLWSFAIRGAATAAIVAFSLFGATFPSERMHDIRLAAATDEAIFGSTDDSRLFPLHRRGLFPNRLWLPGEDLVDDEKLKRLIADNTAEGQARPAYTVDLGERNLVLANLANTDLRWASFHRANMAKTDLRGAWLAQATFTFANMPGAVLSHAELQGARLGGSRLQGASLYGARLYGAWFGSALLTGANLSNAQLQGATFLTVSLHVADLRSANLEGATLHSTALDGALLDNANLRGALLGRTSVWRTRGNPKHLDLALLLNLQLEFDCGIGRMAVSQCATLVGAGLGLPTAVLEELARLAPEKKAPADALTKAFWQAQIAKQERRAETMADSFEQVVCSATGAPHVARSKIFAQEFAEKDSRLGSDDIRRIAARLRKAMRTRPDQESDCPGGQSLTPSDIDRLERLAARD